MTFVSHDERFGDIGELLARIEPDFDPLTDKARATYAAA
jgi:hypothetical protein